MKIKTVERTDIGTIQRECIGDLRQESRNLNPVYHPMQRSREYTRAVTASKLSRMFAQPLIKGNFENGHRDAVLCSAISRRSLLPFVSGSADGCIKIWDLPSRKTVANLETAHSRPVNGLTFSTSGQEFYSCSDDGYIHLWSIHPRQQQQQTDDNTLDIFQSDSKKSFNKNKNSNNNNNNRNRRQGTSSSSSPAKLSFEMQQQQQVSLHGPINSWRVGCPVKSIDHHWMENDTFVTASEDAVQVWNCHRTTALSTFSDLWGSSDTVTHVRYNPAERYLIANCSADRGIGLHDTRTATSLKKTVLRMNSNDLQWNPMEPMTFVVANEDYNAYTFDMRKLNVPTCIYKGHVSAILAVAWAPTGREFVTGSYDKSIRIFPINANGHSREIYHTKRMQRVFTVQYTMDSKFIISGSDDTNLRLWKGVANDQLGQLTYREETAMQYRTALIKKYEHVPEVRNIAKARKVPTTIKKQSAQAMIQKQSKARKHANRVKYDKTGQYKFVAEKKQVVVKEID